MPQFPHLHNGGSDSHLLSIPAPVSLKAVRFTDRKAVDGLQGSGACLSVLLKLVRRVEKAE